MMEFLDATGLYRVTVGTMVMVSSVEGFYNLMVKRAYWDISRGEPIECVDLKGKSGKAFKRLSPGEVGVCLEFMGQYYAPIKFVGDDYAPVPGQMVLTWSDVFHQNLYCEVMARDADIVQLRYGKAISERKTFDCYVEVNELMEMLP